MYSDGREFWTPERCSRLEVLWRDGKSATEIYLEMRAKTRNAVIGKIFRLGLTGEGGSVYKPRRIKPVKYPRRRKLATATVAFEPIASPIPEPLSLHASIYQLTEHICHWPHGDGPPFTYCGNVIVEGYPYCEFHCSRAYIPQAPKLRGGEA